MASEAQSRFAFLYQQEQGTVSPQEWRRAAWPLATLFIALTIIWLFVRPYISRGLNERALFDAASLAANIFGLIYALGVMLLGICWVNLTAKRFRDRGRTPPVGIAGLLPLIVLLDGALRWLQPRIADTIPTWIVFVGDGLVIVALLWTLIECLDMARVERS